MLSVGGADQKSTARRTNLALAACELVRGCSCSWSSSPLASPCSSLLPYCSSSDCDECMSSQAQLTSPHLTSRIPLLSGFHIVSQQGFRVQGLLAFPFCKGNANAAPLSVILHSVYPLGSSSTLAVGASLCWAVPLELRGEGTSVTATVFLLASVFGTESASASATRE